MDEDEKYIEPSWFLDWLEGYTIGRKIVGVIRLLERAWHFHIDRYRLWDETSYRVWSWVVAVAAALLIAGVIDFFGKVYKRHEELRAQAQATAYLAKGDYRNATLSAGRALQFNPNNVTACKVMATLEDRSHSPTVLDWLGRVARNEPTLANQLALARSGMVYQQAPFTFTAKILEELSSRYTSNADYQIVAGELAKKVSHFAEAKGHFASAASLAPTNGFARMNLALLELLSTNDAERAHAVNVLEAMRADPDLGAAALRGLVGDQLNRHNLAGAEVYSGELVNGPLGALPDVLTDLEILHGLKSPQFVPRLKALEERVLTNEQSVADVSTWMRVHGLVEEDLTWMGNMPNSLLNRPKIQENRALGYLQTSNWTRLREVASQGDWGDLEYQRFAYVSYACSQLYAAEMADSNWQAAMKEASSHLEDMLTLFNMAEAWHLKHERDAVLLWMVQDFPDQRWARRLADIYIDSGNTLGLHQLYGILNQHYPTNVICMNDLATAKMLLKLNLSEAYELSAEAYAKDPGNCSVVATYAYGLHLHDRDLQGLAAMQKLPPKDLQIPNIALYYGVLLASAGKHAEAVPWLKLAREKGRLLPEEKQLAQAALDQIGAEAAANKN